ncbi:MAG: hypothetical protein ACI4K8_03630, partial [Candidatus Fimenecus sp.]
MDRVAARLANTVCGQLRILFLTMRATEGLRGVSRSQCGITDLKPTAVHLFQCIVREGCLFKRFLLFHVT